MPVQVKGRLWSQCHTPLLVGYGLTIDELKNYTVRAWFTGHLLPKKPTGERLNLVTLEEKGITDVFLNERRCICNA